MATELSEKRKEQIRQYKLNHPDKVKEWSMRGEEKRKVRRKTDKAYADKLRKREQSSKKSWRTKNREKHNEDSRRWYAENREKVRESKRKYYQRNRGKILEKNNLYLKKKRITDSEHLNKLSSKYNRMPSNRYSNLKHIAKKTRRSLSITKETYVELIKDAKCFYCNIFIGDRMGYGLDRIDNKIGYCLENVVPCCGPCNKIRGDNLTHEEMTIAMRSVLLYRIKQAAKKTVLV